ncbi:E3 SUMO-protein ligase [Blattella germanica]|nr:E3 SUMO-protein ligase [Blattella germanica]
MSKFATLLDPKKWVLERSILFGEDEICELSRRFCISEREIVRTFREYVKSSEVVPKGVLELKSIFNTIPISSSDFERGFSQMNQIMTPERAALPVNTVSNLLFIGIIGPPLTSFDPTKYVKSWLLQGPHSAVDTKQGRIK